MSMDLTISLGVCVVQDRRRGCPVGVHMALNERKHANAMPPLHYSPYAILGTWREESSNMLMLL
jgi:hypothetical protein